MVSLTGEAEPPAAVAEDTRGHADRDAKVDQPTALLDVQLEEQAEHAYRTWLGRPDLNEFFPDKNEADISSIFKWFKGDFEKAGGVKAILLKYAPGPAKPLLQKPDCKITYKTYNWGLNDQGSHGRNWKQSVFDFL